MARLLRWNNGLKSTRRRGANAEHREGMVEDYFAGVLEGAEREAFERHLQTCRICEERLAEVKALDARLREELKGGAGG